MAAGPVVMLPNTFYTFERYLRAIKRKPEPAKSLLLCTGSTANKDIETLVTDYLPKVLAAGFRVSILGLHKASDAPRLASLQSFIDSGQLHICGRLSDRAVAREYRSHRIVWVHSLREGFGRCVVEGRLAGARVICTDIAEFEGLRDDAVHFYQDAGQFMATLDRLVDMNAPTARLRWLSLPGAAAQRHRTRLPRGDRHHRGAASAASWMNRGTAARRDIKTSNIRNRSGPRASTVYSLLNQP